MSSTYRVKIAAQDLVLAAIAAAAHAEARTDVADAARAIADKLAKSWGVKAATP